jgi:hypothetical protein
VEVGVLGVRQVDWAVHNPGVGVVRVEVTGRSHPILAARGGPEAIQTVARLVGGGVPAVGAVAQPVAVPGAPAREIHPLEAFAGDGGPPRMRSRGGADLRRFFAVGDAAHLAAARLLRRGGRQRTDGAPSPVRGADRWRRCAFAASADCRVDRSHAEHARAGYRWHRGRGRGGRLTRRGGSGSQGNADEVGLRQRRGGAGPGLRLGSVLGGGGRGRAETGQQDTICLMACARRGAERAARRSPAASAPDDWSRSGEEMRPARR